MAGITGMQVLLGILIGVPVFAIFAVFGMLATGGCIGCVGHVLGRTGGLGLRVPEPEPSLVEG